VTGENCCGNDGCIVESFIYPTDAQLDCSKSILKFTLKFT